MSVTEKSKNRSPVTPEIQKFEVVLGNAFEPVRPRQEFVRDLRGKLSSPASQMKNEGSIAQAVILISAGVIGSILVVVASIKAILSISRALKLLRQPQS